MFGFELALDRPWYLLLLLVVPILWWANFRSLAGLGRYRRTVALLLRSLLVILLVCALAGLQFQRKQDRMTVIYLLDQSESVPAEQRDAMLRYVEREVSKHRDTGREDRAGVIIFGREANIEIQPLEADLPTIGRLETLLDLRTDATNLSAAMKLAQATFLEDSAKRVVIVTDGSENIGDARVIASMLAEDGIGIDVIPIYAESEAEIIVEKVTLPPDIRKGQPFEARVVVNNLTPPSGEAPPAVPGVLRLKRRMGGRSETLSSRHVDLPPGKSVYRFEHQIDRPDFYEYEAEFVPDDPAGDGMSENNRATAFTYVRGQGHILFIENWETPGQFDVLIDRLRAMNLEVTQLPSNNLFTSLAELQPYDAVILGDVPRTSGSDARNLSAFSDEQIAMLVSNTQQMGAGLLMLGGPNSFGAGGWTNTELEKAMPVDFQINNAKVAPVGALAMVMHASEMAQGNHWQKIIAREALKALGAQDYCGVIHWDDQGWKEGWLWGVPTNGMVRVGPNRQQMVARMSRMSPGDMPEFEPAMKMAADAFVQLPDAAIKHMIIISDGDPSPPRPATIQRLINLKVQVSTVAVGTHGPPSSTPLQKIASQTGGKFYVVSNPNALPRIFQREARRVARPLVFEDPQGMQPQITYQHEIIQGITGPLPPITGFVMTTVKENPLVEVSIVSPKPTDTKNATVLAAWTYGVGRTAVFTSDTGKRWADQWTAWPEYDKFFSQMVRWAMRPLGDQGNFSVVTDLRDGRVQVVVTALDKDEEFLNFLDMQCMLVGPDMQSGSLPLVQTAPGRYVGSFEADRPGSYMVAVLPGAGRAPIRTGVNIPYSAEFRNRQTDENLIGSLIQTQPQGGAPGKMIAGSLKDPRFADLLKTDTFRRDLAPARSVHDAWPLLVLLAGCVFLADVFVRRVQIGFGWAGVLWHWIWVRLTFWRSRAEEPIVAERLERLRKRKEQVQQQTDQRRAATRLEPRIDEPIDLGEALDQEHAAAPPAKPPKEKSSFDQPAVEEENYMDRLRKAKERARKDKK